MAFGCTPFASEPDLLQELLLKQCAPLVESPFDDLTDLHLLGETLLRRCLPGGRLRRHDLGFDCDQGKCLPQVPGGRRLHLDETGETRQGFSYQSPPAGQDGPDLVLGGEHGAEPCGQDVASLHDLLDHPLVNGQAAQQFLLRKAAQIRPLMAPHNGCRPPDGDRRNRSPPIGQSLRAKRGAERAGRGNAVDIGWRLRHCPVPCYVLPARTVCPCA